MSTPDRLQKIISQAGLASRRTAEEWITEGLVTVNGKTAKLGDKAVLGTDAIKVKGKLIQAPAYRVYYLFNKPKQVIAMMNEDEEGRPTLKDAIGKRIKERVFPVGRMDFMGEGLILLTNDGDLAQDIQNSKQIIRRYQVKIDRHPKPEELARLGKGGRIEGKLMSPHHIRAVQAYSRNSLIEISFRGMGALDIRKFFETKGFFPEKVTRVGIGHLTIEKLPLGGIKRIEASSAKALIDQPELAERQIEALIKKKTARLDPEKEDKIRAEKSAKKPTSSRIITPVTSAKLSTTKTAADPKTPVFD